MTVERSESTKYHDRTADGDDGNMSVAVEKSRWHS